MRYILDDSGYIDSVSCASFYCKDKSCQEYTGTIPSGYDTLQEWAQNANIRAYKIVSGNLVYDAAKDAELNAKWAKTGRIENYSTEEQIIGTWIDGKPLYAKTYIWENNSGSGDNLFTEKISITDLNVDTVFIDFSASFIKDAFKGYRVSPESDGIPNIAYAYGIYVDSSNIYIKGYNGKRTITIRYTKTTDEAVTV